MDFSNTVRLTGEQVRATSEFDEALGPLRIARVGNHFATTTQAESVCGCSTGVRHGTRLDFNWSDAGRRPRRHFDHPQFEPTLNHRRAGKQHLHDLRQALSKAWRTGDD